MGPRDIAGEIPGFTHEVPKVEFYAYLTPAMDKP